MSRVYVGRLSYQAREKDVERFFRGFGRIRDINLKNGFGFVVRQKCTSSGGHLENCVHVLWEVVRQRDG